MSRTAIKLLAAAAVGFAAGLLLAPKSGEQTRRELKDKALDAKEYASDKAEQVKGAARSGYETVREGAMEIGDELAGFAGTAKASSDELASEAKTRGRRVASTAEATSRRAQKDVKSRLK